MTDKGLMLTNKCGLGANALRHRAGRAPHEARSGLHHSVTIDFRKGHAIVSPMFTSRTHYGAPVARGHRQFISGKVAWR